MANVVTRPKHYISESSERFTIIFNNLRRLMKTLNMPDTYLYRNRH